MELSRSHTDSYEAVTTISSSSELLSVAVKFTQQLGFTTVTVMTALDRPSEDPIFASVGNPPASYRELYMDYDAGRRDPVMQHCRYSGLPIVWDQRTYIASGQGDKWESMAPHGYATGIALAHHLPLGRHVFIGVDRAPALTRTSPTIERLVADLCFFLTLIQEPALRILNIGKDEPGACSLTLRELETLRWTMEGKTAWEVGGILGISEQTVAKHLHHATRKLDCANKHHAVVKALRLGWIQ